MTLKFSDKYGYLVGIIFHLLNRDSLSFTLLIDKDGVNMNSMPDDIIIEKHITTEYDSQ